MKTSESIKALAPALKEVQHQLKTLKKDKVNPFYKSHYADLTTVVEGAKEILYKNGFAITQLIGQQQGDSTLETVLLHDSGEWLSSEMRLYLTKSDPQAQGSAITYARRYAYMAIIGMVAENEDDDGEKSAIATEKQVAFMKNLAVQAGILSATDWLDFLEGNFAISEANKIPRDKADDIINLLKERANKNGNG